MQGIKIYHTARCLVLMVLFFFAIAPASRAADDGQVGNSIQLMESFAKQATKVEDSNVFSDHKKHVIMFLMGVPLLILILITGALGVAMVVYGKQVFTMHMIFAGLTVTLALAHVVTGLVWFYPF